MAPPRSLFFVETPLGRMQGLASPRGVCALGWDAGPAPEDALDGDPFGVEAAVARYLAGDLGALDRLPVDPAGTAFQQRVWRLLRAIPAGSTRAYGDLAVELGLGPGGSRAVGAANGANPVALIVPCHRVIGADGALTGYAAGVDRKRWLLRHEGVPVPPEQQRLFGG